MPITKSTRPRYPRAPRIAVAVTQELIVAVCRRDSSHCMIAEALKAAVPEAAAVSVDLQTIRYSDRKRRLRYSWLTPRPAQEALIDFDQGNPDIPAFTFDLRSGHVTRMSRDRSTVKLTALKKSSKKTRDIPSEGRKTPQKIVDLSEAERMALRLPAATVLTTHDDKSGVPRLVGGYPPPLGPLARKRAFGLRGLRR